MYHFTLNDVACRCETADELRAALLPSLRPDAAEPLSGPHTAPQDAPNGQAASWAAAREEARRQGRDDVAKVRSEIARKRKRAK